MSFVQFVPEKQNESFVWALRLDIMAPEIKLQRMAIIISFKLTNLSNEKIANNSQITIPISAIPSSNVQATEKSKCQRVTCQYVDQSKL